MLGGLSLEGPPTAQWSAHGSACAAGWSSATRGSPLGASTSGRNDGRVEFSDFSISRSIRPKHEEFRQPDNAKARTDLLVLVVAKHFVIKLKSKALIYND